MLSWSFNITFFLPSRKPKCVPYTYSTFQLRLAAFQVFNNHRWLVTSGLHRTALHALLVHWGSTPVFCSCVWLIGLHLPLHLYSSNHSTSQASSPPGSLCEPPRPRELPALSTTSLLLHCLLCIKNHPVRFLSPHRLVQGQGLCHIHPVMLSAQHRVHCAMGTCYVIFKLNYTFILFGGKLFNFSIPWFLPWNGVTDAQHHSVAQEIDWDDACEGTWSNSGHLHIPFSYFFPGGRNHMSLTLVSLPQPKAICQTYVLWKSDH